MKNLSSAFTMVELVFVIVIVGVLVAVAIPKLMATRDDAKVSKMMLSVGNAISEITSYAVSRQATDSNLCAMSNSLSELSSIYEANCSEENVSIIKMDGVDCIKLKVTHNATNDDLNVSKISTSNKLCQYLQKEINPNLYEVRLSGKTVKY